jgi:preprotein translocase SecF subunit
VTVFDKPQEIADVRKAAGGLPDLAVSGIQLEDEPRGTWFQINTSQSEVDHEQLTEWAVKRVQQQLEKAFGAEANTPTRRQALEAFRKQVVQTLETKPGTAPRDAAVQTLHQRLADLFAGASQSPGLGSTLDTLQWQVNRLVRVNTATDFVEEYLHEELPGRLASNSMRFGELMGIGSAESEAAKASPEGPAHPPATDQTRGDLPGDRVLAMAGEAPVLPPPAKATGDSPAAAKSALPKKKPAAAAGKPAAEGPPSGTAPEGAPAPPPQARAKSAAGKVPASSPAKPVEPSGQAAGAAEPAIDPFAGGTEVQLTFARKVSYDTILEIFTTEFGSKDALPPLQLAPLVESSTPGEPPKPDKSFAIGDSTPYTMWNVKIKLPPQQATARLDAIKAAVADTPFFPSSNTIGGKVAGSTRMQAVYALLASLLCIVAYLWVRFQRVIFGLAAVVALVHDVLITLGAIAISAFLAPYLGFLLIDPFKIGLPVLAAFLTIIGYSLNDTIIVFDRIREVRGKAPRLTEDMVNASVNQTLSRTLLTSGTTLLVIVVLYIAGGEVIHGFAFSLLVGVIVGTYSSIYIASPVLLWMVRPPKTRQIGNPRN